MIKTFYSWQDFERHVEAIYEHIEQRKLKFRGIYAVPKGGLPLGVKLANKLSLPLYLSLEDIKKKKGILIVDDISDTGETLKSIRTFFDYTITLTIKKGTGFIPDFYVEEFDRGEWIVFPWEDGTNKTERNGTEIK